MARIIYDYRNARAGKCADAVIAHLRGLLEEKKERFGFALLLCAHSMPSAGRSGHNDPGGSRADIGRTRGSLKIQDGCDYKCTYCIIWEARGASRSLPMADVKAALGRMVFEGFKEIMLTGINIGQYEHEGTDLAGLLESLIAVPGDFRLRLTSLDTIETDPELHEAIGEDERLMPHFHLSLQSGDDMILKRMKRRHTRGQAVAFCDDVRRRRPDAVFGADLIAGFPTETDAMAENSLKLVDDCGLTFLHVFPFSARPGTPAARMPQLNGAVIRERAKRLRERGEAALTRHPCHKPE